MLRIQDRPGPTRQLEDWGLPVILGLASFAVYWRTCAPDITWAHHGADGGDLLAAVRVLGIPHPPGYPLYVLAARLFALLPVGNFAFRLNLFSACCAALAVVCLYLWLRATLGALAVHDSHLAAWASAAASLLLAFSPLFWSQALITEVYALNALCVALCLLLLARWQTAQRRGGSGYGALALLALLFGLGLGNHPTLLLLLPVLLWSTSPSPLRGRAKLMAAVPAFLIGLSIYLYLPLRASAGPLINWGDPRAWERFWWTVSGKLYHAYIFAIPSTEWWPRVLAWVSHSARQFSLMGWLLAMIGLAALWRDSRRLFYTTLGAFLLYSLYALGYNTPDWPVYLIPAYMLVALWIARGLLSAFERAARWRTRALRGILILSCLLLPLASLIGNWTSLDLSHDYEARDYAAFVLALLPEQAIVITGSDPHTFALWYEQIEQERLDLLVLDRDLLPYSWYRGNLTAHYPDIRWPDESAERAEVLARFLALNSRQAIFLADPDEAILSRHVWQAHGTLYRLVSP